MLSTWKKLTQELLFANPWWKYFKDTFVTGKGFKGEYHYVHTPGSVMILPLFDDDTIQLVRQYRYLHDRASMEFPGGGLKEGIAPEVMAAQELMEEAGLKASSLVRAGYFNPYNGVTDELCHVFVATGLTHVEAQPEDTEEFEFVRIPVSEFVQMIARGEIWDGMTLAAWQLYSARSMK